jgi:hypothetical protein
MHHNGALSVVGFEDGTRAVQTRGARRGEPVCCAQQTERLPMREQRRDDLCQDQLTLSYFKNWIKCICVCNIRFLNSAIDLTLR